MSALQTAITDVRKVAGLIEPALSLALLAQQLTGVGGPGASTAIQVLDAAVKALEAGAAGKLSTADVLARIDQLASTLAANDKAADDADRARWPSG